MGCRVGIAAAPGGRTVRPRRATAADGGLVRAPLGSVGRKNSWQLAEYADSRQRHSLWVAAAAVVVQVGT